MYKTWTGSADKAADLARDLELHLNEYAEEVISVSYAVESAHHALVVYRPIEPTLDIQEEAAVVVVEQLLDQSQTERLP